MSSPIQNIFLQVVNVALGRQAFVSVNDLSTEVIIAEQATDHRELIRTAFGALGIDIEFSGKDIHEKGVVVDIDEELTDRLGLTADTLRFGQTVVRCGTGPDLTEQNVALPSSEIEIIGNKTIDEIVSAQVLALLAVTR